MTERVILADFTDGNRTRAALLLDGRLEDLIFDPKPDERTPAPGEIYAARVDRIVPKVGGAFVQVTDRHQGYLRESKGLREGKCVFVQVLSYPEPGKAAPVSQNLLFKSRWLILTPGRPGVNVSRNIKDPTERERLTACMDVRDEACGVILRTAARRATDEELRRSFAATEATVRALPEVEGVYLDHGKPLWPGGADLTAVREWTDPTPHEIIYCGDEGAEDAAWVFRDYSDLAGVAKRFDGQDLFDHYGVWDEIERLKSFRVDLPSGAWMAIETTRAMVTVDVNTAGEFSGGAALTANLEAAKELPRQLRLRGLGGQIIIDFAPLSKKDRRRIEDALKTSFRRDPIETTLAGWSPLGHFELLRKRERRPLTEVLPV